MQFGTKLVLAAAITAVCSSLSSAYSQEIVGSGPQLFANEYTQTGQATAQMYPAPVPVPQWVGHTYYTYQPLYPHQLTYLHRDRYHSYYDGGRGLNRTRVHYSVPPVRTLLKSMYNSVSIPRP